MPMFNLIPDVRVGSRVSFDATLMGKCHFRLSHLRPSRRSDGKAVDRRWPFVVDIDSTNAENKDDVGQWRIVVRGPT